jgi:NAD(P)H dehydrogenase (quinone)
MIAMTGASGQLGRLIAEALLRCVDPATVRLGSREPDKIADLAAKGFKTATVDFDRPGSLGAAFAGAETVLIISGDAPIDRRIRQQRAAIDAAKAAGLGRIVYTSFTSPTRESLFPFAAIHADTEAYLKASGIAHTILRNNVYAESFPLEQVKATGTLALPGTKGRAAHITRAIYEITGPVAVSAFDVAAILGEAWGRPITVTETDPAEYAKALAERGLPAFVVEAIVGLRNAVGAGEYAAASDDASRLIGRAAESMEAYLRRTAVRTPPPSHTGHRHRRARS